MLELKPADPPPPSELVYITRRQLAESPFNLRRTSAGLRYMTHHSGFPRPMRIGRELFWRRDEVQAWFAAREAEQGSASPPARSPSAERMAG